MDAKDLCLHELIETQARRTPENIAVADEQSSLTYEELDRRAERLAAYLRGAGVREDAVVGVYMGRRVEYVVACLAAMKAGGAFLPLELAYPPSLVAAVVIDAKPPIVLTMRQHEEGLPREQARLCLDEGWEDELGEANSAGPSRPRQDDLVFVSYSSGTTGKPKGIANPHRAAVRSYFWRFGVSDYVPGDRVACNVFFIWEIFRPLLRGATSYVIPDDVIYDPPALIGFLAEHRITETLMTPSLLGSVLDAGGGEIGGKLEHLRTLWLNGEVVTKTLAGRAISLLPETRLLNVYSASETHEVAAGDLRELVDSTSATYCPVGPPRDPGRTYILDGAGRPVLEGEPGELYVGGDCLARGYVNLPEKTAERFLDDRFSGEPGARMYRTGDRARILPDGNMEVMGRVDFMVKVRGYSIELGAVEAAIEKAIAVRGCVVVTEGEEGEDKRLVAYLVPDPDDGEGRYAGWRPDPETGRAPDVRRRLEDRLPHYMIPAVFVELETLPLQETTGKVDRRNLPTPPPRATALRENRAHTVPENTFREKKEAFLARTWESVLGLREGDVGREDGFFDLGGHSLAAAELSARVEDAFGVHVSMRELLEEPTVAGLLERIEARSPREEDPLREAADPRPGPLAEMQDDAVLAPDITPQATGVGDVRLRDARCVFLTGATGFLGAFLLDSLLSRTDAEVRCLVRARDNRSGGTDPLAPVRENLEGYGLWRSGYAQRVVPVVGDLVRPLLGLAEEDFDALAGDVDLIFHAGARVNLVYPYSELKAANVGGTREVLRLACHGVTPVHYISSNGIFPPGFPEGTIWKEDVDLETLAGGRDDGYGRSKWVAEKLVREAGGRGLPVRVYRPGNISGHSVTGASNPRDTLGAILVESLRLRAAPRIEGWRMEMTPVDFVSEAICRIADDPNSTGKAFHLTEPDPPPAEEVFAWLEEAGYALDLLDYPEWAEALRGEWRRAGDGPTTTVGLRGSAPGVEELRDDNTYDDANVRESLRGSGFRRPDIDASLIEKYARYFAEKAGCTYQMPTRRDGRSRGRGPTTINRFLRGRVAVVTGASSGIGAVVARALAGEGASVALAARREDALSEVRRGLEGNGRSLAVPTDVTDRGQVRALVARAEEELGSVDVLVNCAGVMYYTLMENVREEEWERTVEVNCKGALNCVGAVLPGMLGRGRGHIVTISSDAGRKVFPGLAVYSASKFFVEALSQGLRLETAGTGLKVTTVQPGNVATELSALSSDEDALERYGRPSGARVLDSEDVAASVVHVLSQPDHVAVNEVLVEPRDEPI